MTRPDRYYNEKGEIAVLVSPGFGAGWSSWGSSETRDSRLFDPGLVELVLRKASEFEIEDYAKAKWPEEYLGGLEQLEVEWLEPGTLFRIHEYDGSESIEICTEVDWSIA